jgi:hypothetical protein
MAGMGFSRTFGGASDWQRLLRICDGFPLLVSVAMYWQMTAEQQTAPSIVALQALPVRFSYTMRCGDGAS